MKIYLKSRHFRWKHFNFIKINSFDVKRVGLFPEPCLHSSLILFQLNLQQFWRQAGEIRDVSILIEEIKELKSTGFATAGGHRSRAWWWTRCDYEAHSGTTLLVSHIDDFNKLCKTCTALFQTQARHVVHTSTINWLTQIFENSMMSLYKIV